MKEVEIRYLKTIEDIEALRNTDTKIYSDRCQNSYHKFVKGVLCFFTSEDKLIFYNTSFGDLEEHYIEVEVEDEPSEGDIGKLGWFWDEEGEIKELDFLKEISRLHNTLYKSCSLHYYKHFRPLTPREVEAYTGYKVVKEKK